MDPEALKKLDADFTAFNEKLEAQKGSNVTSFTPAHKAEFDELRSRLTALAAS